MRRISTRLLLISTLAIGAGLMAGGTAWAESFARVFIKKAPGAAAELHVKFNMPIERVDVINDHGRVVDQNPGPFELPPDGLDTPSIVLKVEPGNTIAQGERVPTSPKNMIWKYRFSNNGEYSKMPVIKEWWWADANGNRLSG